jgi:hypothetical protein
MWSHYAEKPSRICLGLDVRWNRLEKVCYEAERLRFTFVDPFDPADLTDDTLRLFARTKGQDWSYENEFRRLIDLSTVVSESPDCFIPFDEDMRRTEVIIGGRTSRPCVLPTARPTGRSAVAVSD